jgi:phosphoribosylglycinamide formyltransferase-1
MADKIRIAAFISGSGTNLQAIIDNCTDGYIPAEVVLVVSSSPDAYGLVRAANAGIAGVVYRRKDFPNGKAADDHLLGLLEQYRADLIVLAGYLKMVAPAVITRYRRRIVNIHPGLLPKYGGKGMYGMHVHEAVIAAGEKESGVTVHVVDEVYDHGPILAQEKVPVFPDDTPEDLAARVLQIEHRLYSETLKELSEKLLKERQA